MTRFFIFVNMWTCNGPIPSFRCTPTKIETQRRGFTGRSLESRGRKPLFTSCFIWMALYIFIVMPVRTHPIILGLQGRYIQKACLTRYTLCPVKPFSMIQKKKRSLTNSNREVGLTSNLFPTSCSSLISTARVTLRESLCSCIRSKVPSV